MFNPFGAMTRGALGLTKGVAKTGMKMGKNFAKSGKQLALGQGINTGPSGGFMSRMKNALMAPLYMGNQAMRNPKAAMMGNMMGNSGSPNAAQPEAPTPGPGPIDTAPQFGGQMGGIMSRMGQAGMGMGQGMMDPNSWRAKMGGNTGIFGGMAGGFGRFGIPRPDFQTQGGPASDFMPGGRFGGGPPGGGGFMAPQGGGLWNIYNRLQSQMGGGVPENPQIYY